jgi:hypothetical protein
LQETVKGGDSLKELKRNNVLAVEAVIGEPISVWVFPCFAGKYRENSVFKPGEGARARAFTNQFKALPPNSLTIETGNST